MSVTWEAPPNAAPPANHFHLLYMRMAEINEQLMRQIPDLNKDPHSAYWAATLLAGCAEFSSHCARLTATLYYIQREQPRVSLAWERAVIPPEVK